MVKLTWRQKNVKSGSLYDLLHSRQPRPCWAKCSFVHIFFLGSHGIFPPSVASYPTFLSSCFIFLPFFFLPNDQSKICTQQFAWQHSTQHWGERKTAELRHLKVASTVKSFIDFLWHFRLQVLWNYHKLF